jgi:predicted Zn-dependent protease
MAPGDTTVMDALADVLIQLGQTEKAEGLLKESIVLSPESNPYKWLLLAQLLAGTDALQTYQEGIDFLNKQLIRTEKDKNRVNNCKYLNNTLC